jgi:hypothetical protein
VSLALTALALLAPLAAPTALAAFNGPRPYTADYDYMPELDAPLFTMASGRLEATMPSTTTSFGLIASGGAEVAGLTRVCWTQGTRQCATSSGGGLSIVVADGGSFGVRLPSGADLTVVADHALAMFVDLSGEADLNGLDLGKSLLAPLVGGTVRVADIGAIASTYQDTPNNTNAGALAATDGATTIEVRDGTTVRATLRGKTDPITFAGQPRMASVACDLAVVPFAGAGDAAHVTRAGRDAARVGLDIARINALMERLYTANEGQPTDSAPIDANAFGPYGDAAAALFAGAVLRMPTAGASGADLAFARVSRVDVTGTVGDSLQWNGRAYLEIRDGHVAGAKDLAGFGFLQLPWWSWVLWVLALAVWIVRLVRKPEKASPKWDRLKWVGWVASPLMFLLVLFLWDLEVRALLGMSVLSGTGGGQVLLLVLALQLGTFAAASFAAIAPLRMGLRNGSLLLGQGTFMGLSGAVASLLGFLFTVAYLRSFLDVLVSQVLAGLG